MPPLLPEVAPLMTSAPEIPPLVPPSTKVPLPDLVRPTVPTRSLDAYRIDQGSGDVS